MTCEEARERLMELEVAAFDGVEHLRTCAACRAFAARIRAMDGAVAAHVEDFAKGGDFATEWAAARATARAPRRLLFLSTGVTALALAALTLLMFRPPPPAPTVPAPTATPLAPTAPAPEPAPMAAEPAPAPAPAPVASPRPFPLPARPPRTTTSRPAPAAPTTPVAAPPPPVAAPPPPAPKPSPVAAAPPDGGWVVVRIDPGIEVRSAELACPSGRRRATPSGGTVRFDHVVDPSCRIHLAGVDGEVSADGSYRLTTVDGKTVLVPD